MANAVLPTGGETREGNKKVVYFDHDGPNPYPTGGEDFTNSMVKALGLSSLDFLSVAGASDNGGFFAAVRFSAKGTQPAAKILWFVQTTGAEVANGTDLSARSIRMRAVSP